MTTPKEALEAVLSFLDELAMNAAPGKRQALNPITIGGSAKLYAEGLRASLQGEDAVERVELPLARAINDVLNAMVDAQEEMTTTKISARILGDDTVRAILATGLVPDEAAVREKPNEAQIASACLSYRHDYGLLPPDLQTRTRIEACEWLRAWQKEGFGCDKDEVIERCAAVVDQCNREGPYEAIASAKRIRALKSVAIRSGGGE